MMPSLSDNTISNIKNADYCCISSRISKTESLNLIENANLTEKKNWNIKRHKHLLSHVRMSKEILMFSDTDSEKKIYCHKNFFKRCRYLESINI